MFLNFISKKSIDKLFIINCLQTLLCFQCFVKNLRTAEEIDEDLGFQEMVKKIVFKDMSFPLNLLCHFWEAVGKFEKTQLVSFFQIAAQISKK